MSSTPHDQDRIHEAFRVYRQAGATLSVSIIGFSTALLAWSVSRYAATGNQVLFYLQALFLLAASLLAFLIQFFHYEGHKEQARAWLSTNSEGQKAANRWYSRGDKAVYLALVFLFIGFLFLVALWFCTPAARG